MPSVRFYSSFDLSLKNDTSYDHSILDGRNMQTKIKDLGITHNCLITVFPKSVIYYVVKGLSFLRKHIAMLCLITLLLGVIYVRTTEKNINPLVTHRVFKRLDIEDQLQEEDILPSNNIHIKM